MNREGSERERELTVENLWEGVRVIQDRTIAGEKSRGDTDF